MDEFCPVEKANKKVFINIEEGPSCQCNTGALST